MTTYVTEEEQIEAIKKWWNQYGNHLMTVVVIILLAYSGWKFWHQRQVKIKQAASVNYEQMMLAYSQDQSEMTQAQANTIIERYANTVYSQSAKLLLAEMAVNKNNYDQASNYLKQVMANAKSASFKQIARLRLAKILLYQKQFQQAIELLSVNDDKAYLPLIYELEGDIYAAKGEAVKAKSLYKKAVGAAPQFAAKNPVLMMKLS